MHKIVREIAPIWYRMYHIIAGYEGDTKFDMTTVRLCFQGFLHEAQTTICLTPAVSNPIVDKSTNNKHVL